MYQKKNHKIKTEMKLEIKEQLRDFTWFDAKCPERGAVVAKC